MNLELFDELWNLPPDQYLPEWKMFLGICETYLRKYKIENPIVVELGSRGNNQKKFYEQLLGAELMAVDIARRHHPDIHGDTHDPRTLEALKKRLDGRPINILFIDAAHYYEDVKKDFEIYNPLCDGIVAFHDIYYGRHETNKEKEVWKFWEELKLLAYEGMEEYRNFLFISIYQYRSTKDGIQMGIGVIIKK
ncbi:MAG: class I SAM-dependent methyltransferase [Desulfobacteraceae bacterium]|nr:class I SAM-dependent methyltransferase [Desulfobacteraceae bacterium]